MVEDKKKTEQVEIDKENDVETKEESSQKEENTNKESDEDIKSKLEELNNHLSKVREIKG